MNLIHSPFESISVCKNSFYLLVTQPFMISDDTSQYINEVLIEWILGLNVFRIKSIENFSVFPPSSLAFQLIFPFQQQKILLVGNFLPWVGFEAPETLLTVVTEPIGYHCFLQLLFAIVEGLFLGP